MSNQQAGSAPLEKDFENGNGNSYGEHLGNDMDAGDALKRVRTAGSISISPELFEKIYLSPQNKVAGELRKTFGNPTPFALAGFLLSLTPLSCTLMGWRGAGGPGHSIVAATTGAYLGFGGIMMFLGGIGEWVLGNTFPSVVFGSFGAFWITFGLTQIPEINAVGAFTTGNSPGLTSTGFNSSFAFFLLFMGLLCVVYTVCALRTNVVLFSILLVLIPAFGCLAGAYFNLAEGNVSEAETLIIVGGALTFVVDVLGWYIFAAIMLASLDFPLQLPVGDLSHIVKGASDKAKMKEAHSA